MVNVTISEGKAVFEIMGWDKLWSFRSSLTIPLEHIRNVYAEPETTIGWFSGVKLLGTSLPDILRAGTFYNSGDMVFWDVRNPENAVIIILEHEHFNRLIIEVENPAETVGLLRKALHNY